MMQFSYGSLSTLYDHYGINFVSLNHKLMTKLLLLHKTKKPIT